MFKWLLENGLVNRLLVIIASVVLIFSMARVHAHADAPWTSSPTSTSRR